MNGMIDQQEIILRFIYDVSFNSECLFSRECLNTFIINKKQKKTSLKIYDSLQKLGFELLSDAYITFILKQSKNFHIFKKLPPRHRNNIIHLSRLFLRWIESINEKNDHRAFVLLTGLNQGITSTILLLEDFLSYLGESDFKLHSHYDWFRSVLNSLHRLDFLRKEVDLLSELNLSRGTSIYYTYNVQAREIIIFLLQLIDRSRPIDSSEISDKTDTNLSNLSERQIQETFSKNIESLSIDGKHLDLHLYENGVEFKTDVGRIDLLCVNPKNEFVVIELKKDQSSDRAIGQIQRYMGYLMVRFPKTPVRGLIIANKFNNRSIYAGIANPLINCITYNRISFSFGEE